MLRKTRLTLAIVCYTLITLLLLDFTGTLHQWFGFLAKVQFLPAVLALNVGVVLVLLLLTFVFGRIYCSVICPLGVMQDIIARVGMRFKSKKRRRSPYDYSRPKTLLRWGVLAAFVAAMVAGVGSLVALLAPYSSYGRIAGNLLQPLYRWGNNLLAMVAEHYQSYAFYGTDVWLKSLPTFIIAVVTLLVLAVLAVRGGRTYCNTICPVGTVLGAVSRYSLMRIRLDEDKCRHCGMCQHHCKAACINHKDCTVDGSRCVACGNCLTKCKFNSIHYSFALPWKQAPKTVKAEAVVAAEAKPAKGQGSATLRAFLSTITLGAASAAIRAQEIKMDGGLAEIADKVAPRRNTAITPAGSLSARNMRTHCTACQLCVAACPNGVLRPSTGLMTLMQPTMSYERGYCRPECTECAQVCPAGAIKPITREEKSSIQIGHAVWVKENCVVLTDGVQCGNCARHCPAGAILMVPSDPDDDKSLKIPVVNEERCIGCGSCENLCPARPFSAIYVEGHEEHRII